MWPFSNPAKKLSFVENAANTKGALTVTSGTLNAAVTLLGQYVAAGAHLTSDGTGGTAITYPTNSAHCAPAELAGNHNSILTAYVRTSFASPSHWRRLHKFSATRTI
jgi:hypothetical protein